MLAALPHALDLTEGQAPGHSLRTCVIGMRFAEELGLDRALRSALHYALLLEDAGRSSNAASMSATFGSDDRIAALEEHWDGPGHPGGLRRDAIPLLA